MDPYRDPDYARRYVEATREIDLAALRARFLERLPGGGSKRPVRAAEHELGGGGRAGAAEPALLLDAGCGSGRDARAFLEAGYRVEAMDASPAMARHAEAHAGIPVRVQRLQELDAVDRYDGIWACASLLHVPWAELPDVFRKLERALRPGGVLYVSFKLGEGERTEEGRHFTDLTEKRLLDRLVAAPLLYLLEVWETPDLRRGRQDTRWLNALLERRTS